MLMKLITMQNNFVFGKNANLTYANWDLGFTMKHASGRNIKPRIVLKSCLLLRMSYRFVFLVINAGASFNDLTPIL